MLLLIVAFHVLLCWGSLCWVSWHLHNRIFSARSFCQDCLKLKKLTFPISFQSAHSASLAEWKAPGLKRNKFAFSSKTLPNPPSFPSPHKSDDNVFTLYLRFIVSTSDFEVSWPWMASLGFYNQTNWCQSYKTFCSLLTNLQVLFLVFSVKSKQERDCHLRTNEWVGTGHNRMISEINWMKLF